MDLNHLFAHRNKSYKMLLTLCYLNTAHEYPNGVPFDVLAQKFRATLAEREQQGLTVDSPPVAVGRAWTSAHLNAIKDLMNTPLNALKSVFNVSQDDVVSIRPEFVRDTGPNWAASLRDAATIALEEYLKSLRIESRETTVNKQPDLKSSLLNIMDAYVSARNESFKGHAMHGTMRKATQVVESFDFIPSSVVVRGSIGQGNWANVPWIALMDTRITSSTRDGVYVCYLFSDDMASCYLTIARGVTKTISDLGRPKAYQVFKEENAKDRRKYRFTGMQTDENVRLSTQGLGRDYEASVIAYVKYNHEALPTNDQLIADLKTVMENYGEYVSTNVTAIRDEKPPYDAQEEGDGSERVKVFVSKLADYIASQGFYYSRELLSNILVSLKVRPFVILAGISGTGKSKMVSHLARAFGATRENGRFLMIPVRPDWSDPSDLLGYRDLKGDFVPGPLTELVESAAGDITNPYFVLIDEMNLARVEYYLSDVLSVIETQRWENGRIVSVPLLQLSGMNERDRERYRQLTWPSNVMLIGTVNMDETTHSISKKVLDRATTIEFNDIDLSLGLISKEGIDVANPKGIEGLLAPEYLVLNDVVEEYRLSLEGIIDTLTEINRILQPLGAQVGYRVRDVICFYVVYSQRFGLFSGDEAFDIQLSQKILPRINGSSGTLRRVLFDILRLCVGTRIPDEPDAYKPWLPGAKEADARFPKSAFKTAEMLRRLDEDGFTSYWLS